MTLIGEGNSSPLQYSCLENPMDRGAWQVSVQNKSQGRGGGGSKPGSCSWNTGSQRGRSWVSRERAGLHDPVLVSSSELTLALPPTPSTAAPQLQGPLLQHPNAHFKAHGIWWLESLSSFPSSSSSSSFFSRLVFVTPWTVAQQAPLSMGFPGQEYWSGLPFPSPGDLPIPGIKPVPLSSLALAGKILYHWATREDCHHHYYYDIVTSPI